MKTSGEIVAGIKKGLTNMNYLDTAGTAFEGVVTDTIAVLLSISQHLKNRE
jgi:hypothetical protein